MFLSRDSKIGSFYCSQLSTAPSAIMGVNSHLSSSRHYIPTWRYPRCICGGGVAWCISDTMPCCWGAPLESQWFPVWNQRCMVANRPGQPHSCWSLCWLHPNHLLPDVTSSGGLGWSFCAIAFPNTMACSWLRVLDRLVWEIVVVVVAAMQAFDLLGMVWNECHFHEKKTLFKNKSPAWLSSRTAPEAGEMLLYGELDGNREPGMSGVQFNSVSWEFIHSFVIWVWQLWLIKVHVG